MVSVDVKPKVDLSMTGIVHTHQTSQCQTVQRTKGGRCCKTEWLGNTFTMLASLKLRVSVKKKTPSKNSKWHSPWVWRADWRWQHSQPLRRHRLVSKLVGVLSPVNHRPPEWLCIKVGSCLRHFNVSLIVWAKSQDSVHKPRFLKRKESRRDLTEVLLLSSLSPYR